MQNKKTICFYYLCRLFIAKKFFLANYHKYVRTFLDIYIGMYNCKLYIDYKCMIILFCNMLILNVINEDKNEKLHIQSVEQYRNKSK